MSGTLINALRQALLSVNATAIERGDKYGVCDQIDNDGQPYQSQWLADLLKIAANTAPSQQQAEDADYVRVPIEPSDATMRYLIQETQFGPVYLRTKFWPGLLAAAQPPQVGNGELRKEGV